MLAIPAFRHYLLSRLLSTLAAQMLGVAIGWQVYALTGNLLDLGWIGLAQFAPFILLILPAGWIADRYSRLRILSLSLGLQTLAALSILLLSWHGLSQVWPILALLTLLGCARALMMPASQAVVINLVPAAQFAQATALSSSVMHVAVIAGPVLGGVLYLAGPLPLYGLVVALLLLSVLLLLPIRLPVRPPLQPLSLAGLLDGFRFVWSRKIVLGAMSLDLFAVLFGGAVALLPAFARDVLQTDSIGLGLLRAAPAVGAGLASLVLALYPIRHRVGHWMLGGVALFGVATLVFGLSTNLYLSIAALLLTGVGDMVSVYIRHLLVQLATPDAIRGRVSAVNAVFIGASNELGEFESGLSAHYLRLVPSVVLGGVMTLVVTGFWFRLFPPLSHLADFDGINEAEKSGQNPKPSEPERPLVTV